MNPMKTLNEHPDLEDFMKVLTQAIGALQTGIHPNIVDQVINGDHEEAKDLREHLLFPILRLAFVGGEKDRVEELVMKILLQNMINHPQYQEFLEMKAECMDRLKMENPEIDDAEFERLLGNEFRNHEVYPLFRAVVVESERQKTQNAGSKDSRVGDQDVVPEDFEGPSNWTPKPIKAEKAPRRNWKGHQNFQESTLGSLENVEVQKAILDVIKENEAIWKTKEFLDMGEDWEGVGEEVYKRTGKIVTVPQLRFFWKRTALNFAALLRECICTCNLEETEMEQQLGSIDLYPHLSFYREELKDYEEQLRNEKSGEMVDTRILQRIEQDRIVLSDYGMKDLTVGELSKIGEFHCVFAVDEEEENESPLDENSLKPSKRRRSDEPSTSGEH